VIETLEERRLLYGDAGVVTPLPVALNFTSAINGTLADQASQGTGFTWVQPNKNGDEYNPALIDLQPANGLLNLTTTGTSSAGGQWEADNTLVDGLETQFDATTGAFAVTTRLKGPLSFMDHASDQGGITFGPDQDNYVKFVAESSPSQVLQFIDEQQPAGSTSYTHQIAQSQSYTTGIGNFANISTLDLQIQADPASGTITGAYSVNGGAFIQVAQQLTLSGAQKSAFFSAAARAGIFAMAKNDLPPITVGFSNFSIASAAGSTSTPDGEITGAVIGTPGSYQNGGNTIAKVFDGNLSTYFDAPTANGNWVGLDAGAATGITQISFAPRATIAKRMIGGVFQASNTADFSSGVVNLYTVTTTPPINTLTTVAISDTGTYRYFRYLSPSGSYGNIAEIHFFGAGSTTTTPPPQLTGAVIGTSGSYANSGNTIAKAFDGNLGTYFDAPTASGNWAGLDIGSAANISQISFAPRSGWAGRMVGGIFQASNTADFFAGVVNLYTIASSPPTNTFTTANITDTGSYRYVRYLSPNGGYGNVAEIKFFGTPATSTPTPQVIGTPGSYQNSGNTIDKVFDGQLNTFFDAPGANGNWVGLDFATPTTINQIRYAPRSGYASRMVGGIFQGSSTADFSSDVTNLYTITAAPTAGVLTTQALAAPVTFRYFRYLAPANSNGNVAEIAFANGVITAPTQPSVSSSNPVNGAVNVARTEFVSCDLNLPNFSAGVNPATLTNSNVYLYRTFDHARILAELNTDAASSVVILQPDTPLDASTNYTFVISAGLKDTSGAAFVPFQISFTTGSVAIPTDPSIAFDKISLPTATNQPFTGVTVGPDGNLYASTLSGDIFQFPVNPDGTLGSPNDIRTVITANNGARLITGIAFDPASTWDPVTHIGNLIMWVSHGDGQVNGAADFTGKISTLSGPNFSIYTDYLVGLPRSTSNHLNNQPVFGPDGALYWGQGSNTAMGAPDPVWGNRPERLLNAAVLRLDINAIEQRVANGQGPLNVQTENPPAGQTAYNPYAAGAPLTIYADGLRNDYDLIWDTNGHLYAPTNGSAAGGNTPASPAGYTPAVPALTNVTQSENDFVFDVKPGAYYGHPDPARNEYVMDGGNPVNPPANFPVIGAYPSGTAADPKYAGYAYDIGVHYSPDGAIEYQGSAFNGALDGALLITRYSGGKDILMLRTGANGEITSAETGIAGFTQFDGPVDITEDPRTGFLYVASIDGGTLTLLRPINYGGTASVNAPTFYFNDPANTPASPQQTLTITNTGNQPLSIPAGGLSVVGTDGSLFPVSSSIAFPTIIPVGGSIQVGLQFLPGNASLGIHTAQLQIQSNDALNPIVTVNLRGLVTSGTGGTKEPSLQRILQLYQIPDNVGTNDASQTNLPTPPLSPNDEVVMPRLQKAGAGPVTITPLASFGASISPTSGLGYYSPGTYDSRTPLFSFDAANSQTVNPVPTGVTSFDPGSAIFGLYASFDAFSGPTGANGAPSANPRFAYSEDSLNLWDTSGNNRKVRFYPLKNADGSVVPNAFVFATEDFGIAPNYDSNDIVGIIRNVTAAPTGAEIGLQNIDGSPFPDRFVFNLVPSAAQTGHTTDTLRLFNTGDQPLSISSITSSNPFFSVANAFTYPLLIAPGGHQDVTLNYSPTHTGASATDTGTLTINSNAIDAPVKTIQLQGLWQAFGTGANPTLPQIIGAFGYSTNIVNANQSLNQGGAVQTAGEEVLSSYWQRADANLPVGVQQLAVFRAQGSSSTLYWFNQTSPSNYSTIINTNSGNSQSLLPSQSNGTPASSTFTPGNNAVFGFNVDQLESSDDARNTPTGQGHFLRFWPARDRSGNLIPNTWIMAMDYAGGNFGYNQNVYLIQNMKPAAPAAPSGLTATGGVGGIALSWAASSAPLLSGYNVYRAASSGGTYALIGTAATNAYTDSTTAVGTTAGGTTFYYKITATDAWGGESAFSAVASAARTKNTTPPTQPAGLSLAAAGAGITLSWSANTQPDLAGYNVYRAASANGSYVQLTSSLLTSPGYTDTSASFGSVSYYRVTAVNVSGAESTPASGSATRPNNANSPATPTGLTATGLAADVSLTWSANHETDLAGYNLYRSASANGPFAKVNSTPLSALNYNDTGAPLNATSYYRLTAVNYSGHESAYLAASATRGTATAPATPTNLTVTANSTGIALAWTANSEPNLSGYNVYRASAPAGPFTKLTTNLLTSPGYLDTTAPAGVAAYYQVTAVNSSGAESSPATGKTVAVPAQPKNFTATGSTSSISLTWNANTESDLSGYNLYRGASATGPFTKINSTLLTGLNYNDTTAPTGQTSYYQLTAVDNLGHESIPATASAARSVATAPAQPTGFTATGGTAGIALSWNANTEGNLSGYNIYRASSAAGPFTTKLNATPYTGTTFTDTTAPVGQTSYYQLTAVNTVPLESTPATASAFLAAASGFTSVDIGNPTPAGVTTVINEGSDYDVQAGGFNIDGTSDQFRFVYKALTGNFDVKVSIANLANDGGGTSSYARAGLMARADLSAASANVYVYDTPGPNGFSDSYRLAAGATTTHIGGPANGNARWVRLVRNGDTYTNYASADGINWTMIGSPVTVSLGSTIYVGMAATSHETTPLVTAKFRSFAQA
jgi:fibronectin type 3 domain-containing protein